MLFGFKYIFQKRKMEWMEEGPAGPAQCRDRLPFYTNYNLIYNRKQSEY
jgi:hypothetical protein